MSNTLQYNQELQQLPCKWNFNYFIWNYIVVTFTYK